MMNLYEIVKEILTYDPRARDSDKVLIWQVALRLKHKRYGQYMSFETFMDLPPFESITRARRKVQEANPHLQSSEIVRKRRMSKQKLKGVFIFHQSEIG